MCVRAHFSTFFFFLRGQSLDCALAAILPADGYFLLLLNHDAATFADARSEAVSSLHVVFCLRAVISHVDLSWPVFIWS